VCAALVVAVGCAEVAEESTSASARVPDELSSVSQEAPPCLEAPPVRAAQPAGGGFDSVDEALALVDRDRTTLGLAAEHLALSKLDIQDPRILEATRTALAAPISLPAHGRLLEKAFDEAVLSGLPVTRAILVASALRDEPVSACLDASSLHVPGEAPLATSLAELRGERGVNAAEVSGVPLELQRALVPIVRAMAAARVAIEASRGAAGEPRDLRVLASVPSWILGVRRFELTSQTPGTFEAVDTARITAAAASLAYAIESAELSRFEGLALEAVDLATPLGQLVLRGPGDDVWSPPDPGDAPALLLDTGGNDVYRGAVAAATERRPVSVLVDLGGSDVYGYAVGDDDARAPEGRTLSRTGRQGSGNLGVGLLFDLGSSDDVYRSLVASQGSGSHGVGVLYDEGGSDRYEAEGFSQGAAAWGVGLLLDRAGDDHYTLYNSGQGFGFTRGVGAIVDEAGSDTYVAVPGDGWPGGEALYPSDQLPGPPHSARAANHSFAQGCGAGHRPDWPDPGYPFPGGVGVLRDAAGDDRYVAGVFAQACGFVLGLGVLLDGEGNDLYDGLYYVQGASAHVGAAVFVDGDGDDQYDATFALEGPGLGFAHDLSVAVHYDVAGDDLYRAGAGSLGTALTNSVALFVDGAGLDRFEAAHGSMGYAAIGDAPQRRVHVPSVGVFVKGGGAGTYVFGGTTRELRGQAWSSGATPLDRGIGVDRSGPAEL
jgi:hypothetical protein